MTVTRFSILTLLCLFTTVIFGQEPPTGTRVGSPRSGALKIINLAQPNEIGEIERLLAARQTEKAYALATSYADAVDASAQDISIRYFAHNALCVVYTQMREYDKAMAKCDFAIELMGGHWSAWNNRGTLYYLAEDYETARQDYLNALERAGNSESVTELIRFNLDLVNVQLLPDGE